MKSLLENPHGFSVSLVFDGLLVGIFAGCISVIYRLLLNNAEKLLFTIIAFTKTRPFWIAVWFIVLIVMGLIVGWLMSWEGMASGSGIPQVQGEMKGYLNQNWYRVLCSKIIGGTLCILGGLSLGREGPSVQMGSYIGDLVSKWGHILSGERKQLLAAGAGAGLAAAFAAPLAAATLVIESIERFDAPKTAITTILAGVVAGTIASTIFPITPYHEIQAIVPDLALGLHIKLYLLFAVIVSVFGKFYSLLMLYAKRMYPAIRQPEYIKLLALLVMAYVISLTITDLTGGGEQFLMQQAEGGNNNIYWIAGMMLLHMVFTVFSFSSGLPGGSFIPTLVTGGLIGKLFALVLVQHGVIGMENVSYVMLIGMAAFLIAVVRTPITAIILITEITAHFEVFYPSIVVGGLTYYFTELLEIKPFNVMFYEEMINKPVFREQKRLILNIEIMAGAYFDGKDVDTLELPNHCVIQNIHRDHKDTSPTGQTILPGDQLTIELDAQDIEKLYEPLVSMANIH